MQHKQRYRILVVYECTIYYFKMILNLNNGFYWSIFVYLNKATPITMSVALQHHYSSEVLQNLIVQSNTLLYYMSTVVILII